MDPPQADSEGPVPVPLKAVPPSEVPTIAMPRRFEGAAIQSGWIPPTVGEMAALIPQVELSALTGRGGMGAVYRGRQRELHREVAVKVLPVEVGRDASFAHRFRTEARALAALQHPNIIQVFEFGETSAGHLYIVMEFVDGTDMQKIIRLVFG